MKLFVCALTFLGLLGSSILLLPAQTPSRAKDGTLVFSTLPDTAECVPHASSNEMWNCGEVLTRIYVFTPNYDSAQVGEKR